MTINSNIFNPDDIIDSFRANELDGHVLWDILPRENSPTSKGLKKWQQDFTRGGVPWALTKNKNDKYWTLWKIDQRLNEAEIKAERKKPGVNWFADK